MKRARALWISVVSTGLVPALGCGSAGEGPPGSPASGGSSRGGAMEDGTSGAAPAAEPELVRIPFLDDMGGWGREVEYAQICAQKPCPTLEQVLVSNTSCSSPTFGPSLLSSRHPQIVTGCGIIQVHFPGMATYWYEGFGSPPVAVGDWSGADTGGARWGTTRSLACARNEQVICSICDDGYPACGEPSNWLRELPQLPAGCSCEPDGEGGARVSLDCFCSFYKCPAYSAAVHDCKVEPGDQLSSMRQAHSGCGQTSFGSDHESQYHHGYDAVTGRLIAADFSMDAPVAWPCFTSRITAGSAVACETAVDCECNTPAPGEALNRCNDESWFQTLVASVPEEP